jgi:uncharacterized membrane protein
MNLFSDRKTVKFITKIGLLLAVITDANIIQAEGYGWYILLYLLSYALFDLIVFSLKSYRNIVFKDEKNQAQNDIVNIIAAILFPACCLLSYIIFAILTDLNYDLHWNTWSLIVNIVYFASVFVFFINKLHTNDGN